MSIYGYSGKWTLSHKYFCALQLWLMVTTVILALILHQCWLQIKNWPASLRVLQGIIVPAHYTTASLPNSVAWCVGAWCLANAPYLHRDHLSLSATPQTAAQWKQRETDSYNSAVYHSIKGSSHCAGSLTTFTNVHGIGQRTTLTITY